MSNEGDIINQKRAENTNQRIDYKPFLGMTLTERVTLLHNQGKSAQEAFKIIMRELCEKDPHMSDFGNNVWIGINARYGEQNSAERRKTRVNGETKDYFEKALENFVKELDLQSLSHPECGRLWVADKLRFIMHEAKKYEI